MYVLFTTVRVKFLPKNNYWMQIVSIRMPSNDTNSSKGAPDIIFSILNSSPFKLKSDEEKLKIIKIGRPQPSLSITVKDTATNSNRSLQSWYSIYKWLCGSKTHNKVFCWPCLLMRPETSSWCSIGTSDLKKFPFLATKHALSKSHLKAVSEYNETLSHFHLPIEFVNEINFGCKEEGELSGQTDDDNDLTMDSEEVTKKKSLESQVTFKSGESNSASYNSRSKPKITFKTWQEIHKNIYPVSKENFIKDINLYKWQKKIAKQEFKNCKLTGEKLKLEIEVLKAKAEFYKALKENSNDDVPSAQMPATIVPEVSNQLSI